MGELAPLLTGAGGLGAFVAVIIYLLGSNRADRREYQDHADRSDARKEKAEARVEELQKLVDEARAGRRAAEDRAALAERELARYRNGSSP